MMAIASAFGATNNYLICPSNYKQSFHSPQYKGIKFNTSNIFQGLHPRITERSVHYSACQMSFNHAAAGRDNQLLSLNDELPSEPFLLSLAKEAVWGLRSLFIFLAEQPSQLKYIEWPGFQSTLKTATLTLILVALLIVALSSVDSALSFILTLLLRKTT